MEVSRQTALEIFGLKDNFTKDEVNKNFRRLSKIVHPDSGGDENLFRLIMCCKETLSDTSNVNDAKKTQETQKTQETRTRKNKEQADVNLTTLYDIYHVLSYYTKEYDIDDIIGEARIYITPYRKKKLCKSINIEVRQSFKEFERLGFVNFATTLIMPEIFKKFKKFNVRVEFMGETYKFILSEKNPFYIVKYNNYFRFNSIIELKFEY